MKREIYELISKLGPERKIRAAALIPDEFRDTELRQIFKENSGNGNTRWRIASQAAEQLSEPERSEKLFVLLQQIVNDNNFNGAAELSKLITGQLKNDSFEVILSALVKAGNFGWSKEYAKKLDRELTMDELEGILKALMAKQTYDPAGPVADEIMTRLEEEKRQANERTQE